MNMGKVMTSLSMSLDGFVAGPNDDVQQVFAWMMSGDTDIPVQSGRMVLKVSPQSAKLIEDSLKTTGAMVAGRRMFDLAKAWGGSPRLSLVLLLPTPFHRNGLRKVRRLDSSPMALKAPFVRQGKPQGTRMSR
jgi:hypothetical protein